MKRPEHIHKDEGCAVCALDRTGLRVTKQRQILYEVLLDEENPISVDQIHFELKSRGVDINLSTVYRSLEQFVEKDLVLKSFFLDDTKALYSINKHVHHHHLICTKCKEIVIINGCPIDSHELEIKEKYNHQTLGHKFEIYGLCPKGQK